MVSLKDKSCFSRRRRCLRKQDSAKHGSHPTILARWYAQERYRDSLAKHYIGLSTATRICRCIKTMPYHARCLAGTEQSLVPIRPQHQQRQRQNQQFEGGENFVKLDGGTAESHASSTSQWPTSQWQTSWSSWQPASSRKSTGCVDRTPTHNTHLCSTVRSQARNANHALGSSKHGLHFIFCAPEMNLSSGVVLSPAVYHEHIIFLMHSFFHHDTRTRRTPRTSHTSPSTLSRQAAPSRITLA